MRTTLTMMAALLAANCLLADDNWPQFRGPNGDGHAESKQLPVEFGEAKNVKWRTEIPGKGWSSPVVWKNQIWLTTATEDGKKMSALCVDADSGRIVHDLLIFENAKPEYCHPTNSYASPTPVIEEGRLYVHFGTYGTACLDTTTGETLWSRRDLHCNHYRGPASSPIVDKNILFLAFDGIDLQYVVALDKSTGKTLWKKDRDIDYNTDNGDRKKAYSTAHVITVQGKSQIISPAAMETLAYDPANGDVIWRVRHGGMNAASRPLYEDGIVYISTEGSQALVAVRADGRGDVTKTHVVWKTGKTVPRKSSQLIVGDLFFMVNDSGVMTCLDAKTGKIHWQKRVEGEYWASPLYANGRIYLFSNKGGHAPVIAAKPKFELLAENKLDGDFNASPAVAGDDLILRTFTHLYRIGESLNDLNRE